MTTLQPPTRAEVEAAAAALAGVIVRTPLVPFGDPALADRVWLKPELLQPTGSFKLRGVHHAVASLSPEQRARGLSTVSAGNTAKALAWCGRRFGVAAKSRMPEGAPTTKVEGVRALGGTPVLVPTEELFRFLRERAWEREPEAFVHPWISREMMIGHGTLGLEIAADAPELDTVYVPVGGGGLLGGVGGALRALRPSLRIVAVEPADCAAFHASLAAGRASAAACATMCDGVAVPYVTEEMFPLLRELVDDVVLVEELEVRAAIRALAARNQLVVEGAGALALAAALKDDPARRGRCVCVVSGGNIDLGTLRELLAEDG